jgi:DNA-binding transcriptional LysR family regulator
MLESELGTRLLNRTTRRLRLTDDGEQYLHRSRTILSAVHDAEAEIASRRVEPQGRLVITASVLFGRLHIVPLVNRFLSQHAGVKIELMLLDRVVNMIEEGVDIGIRIGSLADSSLVAIPVGQVRRVVCASPAYLKRCGAPSAPEQLGRHNCIGFSPIAPSADWRFPASRRDLNVPVRCVLSCNQVDAAIQACLDGLGIGMFLSYQVATHRMNKKLRYILDDHEPEQLPIHVVYPQARHRSAASRAFVELCVETLRKTTFD